MEQTTPRGHASPSNKPMVFRPIWLDHAIVNKAVNLLAPWNYHDYPGKTKVVLGYLSRPRTWFAVMLWRNGKRRMPSWAARDLSAACLSRGQALIEAGNALADYATAEDAKPPVPRGFMRNRVAELRR